LTIQERISNIPETIFKPTQDRRPSSNADPYAVTDRVVQTMILDDLELKQAAHSKETQTPDQIELTKMALVIEEVEIDLK
jgi:hypothetical protein